ncbi:WD40 repeat domain-containing protein [Kitasatospora sp. NPDC002227]|uniref:WD40 repeat domain-containing protein n=1 Tax=Kitasatospora sp. NPDC002227 TaxID=3154773 RepID=UPI00331D9895
MPGTEEQQSGGAKGPGIRLSLGGEQAAGGRTELLLGVDGALRVERLTEHRHTTRLGRVDGALTVRLLAAIRAAGPGLTGAEAPAGATTLRATGLLPGGDALWAEGTTAPLPEAARLVEALAAQALDPADAAALPAAGAVFGATRYVPVAPQAKAVIGAVEGRPAYAIAETGQGYGLADLATRESLGSSGPDAGLVPTSVALATVDGREVFAVGAEDGAVQVWDAVSGVLLHGTSGGEGAQVVAAGLVQGVSLAFSAGAQGDIRAWRAEDGRPLGLLDVEGAGAAALAYAHCAGVHLLAAAGEDAVVRVWDVSSGQRLHLLVGHRARVTTLAVLSLGDQALLASAGQDGEIRLWDLATGLPHAVLAGHSATVTGLVFLEVDGAPLLASSSLDGTVRTWDVYEGTAKHGWPAGTGWLTAVATLTIADTPAVVTGDEHGRIALWHPASGAALGTHDLGAAINILAVTELDGRPAIVTGHTDGTLRLTDAASRTEIWRLAAEGGPVTSLAVSEGVLVCGTAAGAVRCHTLRTGVKLSVPTPHTGPVTALGFAAEAPGGAPALLASAGADGTVRVRQALDGTPLVQFTAHPQGVTAMALGLSDGHRLLATAGAEGTVRLWDAASGGAGPVLDGLSAPAETLAFGVANGLPVVVAGTADGKVLVWGVRDGVRTASFDGGATAVRALAVQDLDGEVLLAAGDEASTVRLWHLASGTLLNEAQMDRAPLAIAFGEAGLHVVGVDGPTLL